MPLLCIWGCAGEQLISCFGEQFIKISKIQTSVRQITSSTEEEDYGIILPLQYWKQSGKLWQLLLCEGPLRLPKIDAPQHIVHCGCLYQLALMQITSASTTMPGNVSIDYSSQNLAT